MANERSRDFMGGQSHGFEQGGAERRDPGAEALLELARLIGGPNDPPDAPKADHRHSDPRPFDPRLSDVSRAAASGAAARRDPGFGAGPSDFPELPDRGDYPVAPRNGEQDFDFGNRRAGGGAAYRRRRGEYRDEYAEDSYGEPEEYEEGDDGAKRRRPTKVVLAVLALAVFGSAAAYGYRHMVTAGPSGPLPIIRADNTPTKITPMSDVRTDGGRDRIGEQLVRREEDPVDAAGTLPGGAPALPASGSRRVVQTVPIRVEQGASPSAARAAPAPAMAAQLAPRPAAPVPPPQRVASAQPDTSGSASEGPPGGYVVQLSAVRSEADAQTAFRQLQAKYPMLSGRQPMIRRKDLGDKGVFFAAQLGPFGAKSEAAQLCDELKAAGGSCFVQRN
jgi:cell division septation protein DedD